MNVQEVFRKIAAKLAADFAVSAEVKHDGSKGALREDALRQFLKDRLPGICAIGSGEIVGPTDDTTSRQCDLIIYDRLHGVPLLYGETSQVFPIECVFGTIEVKSHLSKEKLLAGLENIRSVKALVPNEAVVHEPIPGGFRMALPRPRPYGMIFAYDLDGNSLSSLEENLVTWESSVPEHLWPNLVVVLGHGALIHMTEKARFVLNNDGFPGSRPIGISYGADSLFHAYAAILDLTSATALGTPNIRRYYDLPKRLGRFSVKNHDHFIGSTSEKKMRLTEAFVERVVTWCKDRPMLSKADIVLKQLGQFPVGTEAKDYAERAHLYDPDQLPGFHQVENPFVRENGRATARVRMQMPCWWILVNGVEYIFPSAYISEEDVEEY